MGVNRVSGEPFREQVCERFAIPASPSHAVFNKAKAPVPGLPDREIFWQPVYDERVKRGKHEDPAFPFPPVGV